MRFLTALIVIAAVLVQSNEDALFPPRNEFACPPQPLAVQHLLLRPGLLLAERCIFQSLTILSEEEMLSESSLLVSECEGVPDNQGWSHCQHCGWENDKFLLFTSDNVDNRSSVDLSWSLWGEFFFKNQNDQFKGEANSVSYLRHLLESSDDRTIYYVDRPVYILPMITFHVGHILIDLLEQVYRSMMSTYGMIRLDALIILDVASVEEREILQEKLYRNIHDPEMNLLGSILNLFTELPVLSMEILHDLSRQGVFVLFKDVHIGLDNSETFFYKGYSTHPFPFSLHNQTKPLQSMTKNYLEFRDFIQNSTTDLFNRRCLSGQDCSLLSKPKCDESINMLDHSCVVERWANSETAQVQSSAQTTNISDRKVSKSARILFIQREQSRSICNLQALQDVAKSEGSIMTVRELGDVGFSEQVFLFENTDILIAVAGTAIHNMLFMKSGTSVIILMQPGWCDWSWMYSNQAVLLGINYFIYCSKLKLNNFNPNSSTVVSNIHANHQSEVATQNYDDIDTLLFGFHWTRKYWLQGPRTMKSENVTVDPDIFLILLQSALKLYEDESTSLLMEDPYKILIGEDTHSLSSIHEHDYNNKLGENNDRIKVPGGSTNSQPTNHIEKSSKLNSKILEVFISSINVEEIIDENTGLESWKIALLGEFVCAKEKAEYLAASMPHLVICLKSVLSRTDPWCTAIAGLNYFSDIFMTIHEPVQYLHLWAQVSETGGKIKGSDVFYTVDASLPYGGSKVHTDSIGLTIRDIFEVEEGDIDELSGNRNRVTATYNQYISDKYTLQRSTIDFCRLHFLNDFSCSSYSSRVSHVAYNAVQMRAQNMPDKQYYPTPEKPLVFIHIEKTGGTTLREFITESADRLGIRYFVPCHNGVHCVTLSLTEEYEKKGLGSHDGEYKFISKDDLRTELKNVSIVAGHFFWDVWQHLPSAVPQDLVEGLGVGAGAGDGVGIGVGVGAVVGAGVGVGVGVGVGDGVSAGVDLDTSAGISGAEGEIAGANAGKTASTMNHTISFTSDISGNIVNTEIKQKLSIVDTVKAVPHCIIMGRHPVDRAISYYYQRCYRVENCVGYKRKINDLTVEELLAVTINLRQGGLRSDNETVVIIDEGLENAACRALANEKATTGLLAGVDEISLPPPLSQKAINTALNNIQHCVVGILERWDDSKRVFKFWFPWLDFTEKPDRKRMYLYVDKEKASDLKPELYELLIRLNTYDIQLYEKMLNIFDTEVTIISTATYGYVR